MEITPELKDAVDNCTDFDSLVAAYVMLRDSKEEAKREFTERTAPIEALIKTAGQKLLELLDASGQEGAKTKHGSVYKTKKTSAKVVDWNFVLEYIRKHEAWDLLTHAVSKDAVKARVDETGEIVPGVDLVTFIDVGVRRA